MSEIILGTIIGGTIASIVPIITIFIEYKKWKKTQIIENLREKRKRLEQAYQKAVESLKAGIINDYFSIEMIADFEVIFPREVCTAFHKYIKEKKENKYEKALLYQEIIKSMKKSLAKLDQEIESISAK